MKIGILYICTGKYEKLFDEFYSSSEDLFLKDCEKYYYVFTDSQRIIEKYKNIQNIVITYQEQLCRPLNTLLRFYMFKKIEKQLEEKDFLLFFNANTLFLEEITKDEFLPDGKKERLLGALHCYFYKYPSFIYPYERNRKSTAYIPIRKNGKYLLGGLNGGFTKDYLKLINQCFEDINTDFSKNFIAEWHDESYLNKYFLGRDDVKILDISYSYIEQFKSNIKQKILFRNKENIQDTKRIKNLGKEKLIAKICRKLGITKFIKKILKVAD